MREKSESGFLILVPEEWCEVHSLFFVAELFMALPVSLISYPLVSALQVRGIFVHIRQRKALEFLPSFSSTISGAFLSSGKPPRANSLAVIRQDRTGEVSNEWPVPSRNLQRLLSALNLICNPDFAWISSRPEPRMPAT